MVESVLDEEERGTKRKEGRGGRRKEESEKMKKLLKKVAEGRIIGLARPCFLSLGQFSRIFRGGRPPVSLESRVQLTTGGVLFFNGSKIC